PARPAVASTSCWVTQQIVSSERFGEKKYSIASVGTTLSFASVCVVAGRPTVSSSTESISPSGSTAVPSTLTCQRPGASCATAGAATRAGRTNAAIERNRSEEHTSELQSRENLVCRLLLEK